MQEHQRRRRLSVRHVTRYSYEQPVTRSTHRLHLKPIEDWRQQVLSHRLSIRPTVQANEYEDVFGNWGTRFEINEPYTELEFESTSTVEVLDVDPFAFAKTPMRPTFPLHWMPWQEVMLRPYLVMEEFPESQIQAMYDYAMGFVRRNNGDLMEVLFDMNLTFFRDYQYVPNSTTLTTTPFEVMCSKRGVCQDFTTLFINLARLLRIPARYVCGYIYTGNTGESRAQSDASHAWIQLYIPNVGWKGFDPTNGVLPHLNHVRVAYGRHYRDATPTAGVIYGQAARESMTTEVQVHDLGAGREHEMRSTAI